MKKLLLPIFIFVIAITCTKEKSCEDGCGGVVVDTIPKPVDTLPYIDTSRYFVYFDTLISNNNDISHINMQVLNNSQPVFWTFNVFIKQEDEPVWRYSENVEVTWLMEYMPPGDTAVFRMAVVYRVNGIPNFREEFSPIVDTVIKL